MAASSGRTTAAPTEKSPDAFRTISEVSEELDLPQHVLRFWETRFSQIRPLKRGGGRRLYRPDHIALLRGIKALLYDDGMTIKGVQKVLRERGQKAVMARGRADATLGFETAVPGDAAARLAALRTKLEAADSGASERATKARAKKEPARKDEEAPAQAAFDLGDALPAEGPDETAPATPSDTPSETPQTTPSPASRPARRTARRPAAVAQSIDRLEAVLQRLERD